MLQNEDKLEEEFSENDFSTDYFNNTYLGKSKAISNKEDLGDILTQIGILISTGVGDEKTVNICSKLLKIHRAHENTKARIRLELWCTRVIAWYLIVLALLLILIFYFRIQLSNSVIVALLTTTTANILGLGFIILRGHFHNTEKESEFINEDHHN